MTLRFGTDGVRGVANVELTPELVTALGRAAARVLGLDQPFVVGRDTRRSGPMLEAALVAGLCAEGADVVLVGVLPTPGVAHAARERGAPAAVISASHNPFGDNGIKLFAAGGRKIPEALEHEVEHELRELAVAQPEPGPEGFGVGVSSEHRGALDDYVAMLVDSLQGRQLDRAPRGRSTAANGAAFRAAPNAFARARCDGRRASTRRPTASTSTPGAVRRIPNSSRRRCWSPGPTPASPSTATPTG